MLISIANAECVASAVVPTCNALLDLARTSDARVGAEFLGIVREFGLLLSSQYNRQVKPEAVAPYEDETALLKALQHEIDAGLDVYLRFLETVESVSTATEEHALAADLIGRCANASDARVVAYLQEAVSKETRPMYQAIYMMATKRLHQHSVDVVELWTKWMRSVGSPTVRFLAATFLMCARGKWDDETASVFCDSIEASSNVSLVEIMESESPRSRFSFYKMYLDSPKMPFPNLISDDVFELLRSAFNDNARYWVHSRTRDVNGRAVIRYTMEGPKLPPVAHLDEQQRQAVKLVIELDALWEMETNFWEWFGLPSTREALSKLLQHA
jgi:hypothetical protein